MSMKAHLPNKLGAVDIDDLRLYPLKYREGTRSLVKPFHPSDLIADIDDGSSPDSPFVVGRQDDFPWPLPTTSYATYREGQVTILEHSAVDVVSY